MVPAGLPGRLIQRLHGFGSVLSGRASPGRCTVGVTADLIWCRPDPANRIEAMEEYALTVKAVRDGLVCALIRSGGPDA
jgi:hypothetical protein